MKKIIAILVLLVFGCVFSGLAMAEEVECTYTIPAHAFDGNALPEGVIVYIDMVPACDVPWTGEHIVCRAFVEKGEHLISIQAYNGPLKGLVSPPVADSILTLPAELTINGEITKFVTGVGTVDVTTVPPVH